MRNSKYLKLFFVILVIVFSFSFVSGVLAQSTAKNTAKEAIQPKISIPIPNMPSFSQVMVEGGKFYAAPWITQYLVGIYSYGITFGAIVATLVFMIGGFMYVLSGATPSGVQKSKSMMTSALLGLVILLTSNLILKTINPNLTTLKTTVMEAVAQTNLDAYLTEFGSEGPELTGELPPPFTGPIPPGGLKGPWRTVMSAETTCGQKNNGGLPMAERQKALAKIILIWKTMAADQGGAIYIHGGSWTCSYSNAGTAFLIHQMTGRITKGKTADFSPTFLASYCGQLVSQIIKSENLTGNYSSDSKKITAYLKDKAHYEIANKCTDVTKPKNMVEVIPTVLRTAGWKHEYDYLLTKRAKENNLVCGDCGTFMVGLFHGCFDNSYTSDMIKRGGKGKTMRFDLDSKTFKSDIPKYVGMLKFGDMIRMQTTGHFVLYTGGYPGINFEILEMGGGGKGDTVGKEKAKANAGTPLDASGVTAHASAIDYFKNLSMKYQKISAYGVIDQTP